jgi:hypothetical protein
VGTTVGVAVGGKGTAVAVAAVKSVPDVSHATKQLIITINSQYRIFIGYSILNYYTQIV